MDQRIAGASIAVDDLEVVTLRRPVKDDDYGSKSTTENNEAGKKGRKEDREEEVATTTELDLPEDSTVRIEAALRVEDPLAKNLLNVEGEDLDNQFGSSNDKDDSPDTMDLTTETAVEDTTSSSESEDFEIITFNTTQEEMENSSELPTGKKSIKMLSE